VAVRLNEYALINMQKKTGCFLRLTPAITIRCYQMIAQVARRTTLRPRVAFVRPFCDAPDDPIAIQAIVDAKILKKNQTITPWHAREDLSLALKVAPVENPNETLALTDIPEEYIGRKVKIHKPAKAAMQSATHKYKCWQITMYNQERWVNPLMGWTSTGDAMSNLAMKFETAEDAEKFAVKMGWEFETEIEPVKANYQGRKSYHHNFLTLAIENNVTKGAKKFGHTQFKHKARETQWVKTLTYHGESDCIQHGGDDDAKYKGYNSAPHGGYKAPAAAEPKKAKKAKKTKKASE
jgi:NADH dehydrogenase (ubiquinone) Fe-S protein 4